MQFFHSGGGASYFCKVVAPEDASPLHLTTVWPYEVFGSVIVGDETLACSKRVLEGSMDGLNPVRDVVGNSYRHGDESVFSDKAPVSVFHVHLTILPQKSIFRQPIQPSDSLD